jgi:hypothetical protein
MRCSVVTCCVVFSYSSAESESLIEIQGLVHVRDLETNMIESLEPYHEHFSLTSADESPAHATAIPTPNVHICGDTQRFGAKCLERSNRPCSLGGLSRRHHNVGTCLC